MIDEIQSRFPNPIARVIGDAATHKDADRTRRLVAASVQYAGLTTVARLVRSGGVPAALQAQAVKLLERPALGEWVEFIGRADKELVTRGRGYSLGVPLSHVPERLADNRILQREMGHDGSGTLTVGEILRLHVQWRKAHSHERLSSAEAGRLAQMVVRAVAELVGQLPSLTRESLLLARVVVIEHDQKAHATFVKMHGDGKPRLHEGPPISAAAQDLARDRLFLHGSSSDLTPLYPLMVSVDERIYWINGDDYYSPEADSCPGPEIDAARKVLRTLIDSWQAARVSDVPTAAPSSVPPHLSAPPPDISGYLTATALGERLVERLTPAGANLYRQKLGMGSLNGSISALMVNDLLKHLKLLEESDSDRRITANAANLAIETASASPRGENIRVIRWKPEVLDVLLAEVRKRIGAGAMQALEANPTPDYDTVGGMTGRRALDEQLTEYIAEVTGLAKSTVTKRLNASPVRHVRNTFADSYDSVEALGHLTARRALELNLVRTLAALTGRSGPRVGQRLREATPQTRVGTLFPSE
ncbi:MAG: hypothetical protein Q8M65_03245 [Rhodoglobus sp.]|nr:hypothetical protein [Rhodoglobus sp.]